MVSNIARQVATALLTASLSLLGCILLLIVAGTLYLASKAQEALFETKTNTTC